MEINRYTQMPQPLVVNPISFEEFARVPLMKAKAIGQNIGAIERINTDYNVDDADLNKITDMVSGIDEIKSKLVDDITSTGLNSQTVGKILNLKRERDKLYKTKIQQAEENKKLLFAWRQRVDEMTMRGMHSPEFGEIIKNKEYKNWVDSGGSFREEDNGLPRMFQENFGVKYFDIEKDALEHFALAARQGDVKTTSWGGGKTSLSEDIPGYTTVTTSGGGSKTVATNEANLDAVVNQLYNEYIDSNTERGQYATYAGVDLSKLRNRLLAAKKEFLDTKNITQIEGGHQQYLKGNDKMPLDNTTAVEFKPFRESKYKVNPNLKEQTGNTWGSLVETSGDVTKEHREKNIVSQGFVTPSDMMRVIDQVRNKSNVNPKDVKSKILLLYKYPHTLNELTKTGDITPAMISNAKGGQMKWVDIVLDKIYDYQKKLTTKREAPAIVTEDYMRTEFGIEIPKVSPEDAAKDIFKGDYNYFRLEDRTEVKNKEGDEEFDEIRKNLAKGTAEVQGNIPMLSPDLLDENGNYIKGMSGGRTFTITDKESPFFGKTYYVKLSPNLRETANFKRMEEVNERILSLPVSESAPMWFYNDRGQIEKAKVVHIDSSPGTYDIVTSQGQYTLNENPQILTRIYGDDYFNGYIKPLLEQVNKKK